MTESLRCAARRGIVHAMAHTRPPCGTIPTARFWYRWFKPAA
jgi:hypothetical protein